MWTFGTPSPPGPVPSPLAALVDTRPSWAPAAAALALAVVVFPHGAQKLLGWFGGKGVEETLAYFAPVVPPPLMALVVLAESVGAVLVVAGDGRLSVDLALSQRPVGVDRAGR